MRVVQRKENRVKFRLSFVLLFAAAAMACCFVFYMKENQPDSYYIDSDAEIKTESVSENTKKDISYFDECLFIGGKVAHGLCEYGIISESRFAMQGKEPGTADISDDIANIYFIPSAEELGDDVSGFAMSYCRAAPILAESGKRKVYIVSLLTTDKDKDKEKIAEVNRKLLEYAELYGFYYVDIGEMTGILDKNISESGSIYPGKAAYDDLTDILLTHTVG